MCEIACLTLNILFWSTLRPSCTIKFITWHAHLTWKIYSLNGNQNIDFKSGIEATILEPLSKVTVKLYHDYDIVVQHLL